MFATSPHQLYALDHIMIVSHTRHSTQLVVNSIVLHCPYYGTVHACTLSTRYYDMCCSILSVVQAELLLSTIWATKMLIFHIIEYTTVVIQNGNGIVPKVKAYVYSQSKHYLTIRTIVHASIQCTWVKLCNCDTEKEVSASILLKCT